MKLASVTYQQQRRIGIVRQNERCFVLEPGADGIPDSIEAYLASEHAQKALAELESNGFEGVDEVALSDVHLNPPLKNVNKVICIGKNYADHAREMGGEPPKIPVVFSMFPSAIVGPGESVVLPGISHPFLVTKNEVDDPHQLKICCRLNGEVMQSSSTSSFIFQIDFLISHLSQFMTLAPGDLIFTGTPPGVGAGRKPPLFLSPGDTVEVEIESVGALTNPIVAEV